MAASWGVSRTMAEIHALLFISNRSLCADDLMEALQVSRGNVSMNLRQLANWGLIHRAHRRGDRKEYFEAEGDIWHMFEIITRERRRREVQPIVETIERCREMLRDVGPDLHEDSRTQAKEFDKRLREMAAFFQTMNELFNVLMKAGGSRIGSIIKLVPKALGSRRTNHPKAKLGLAR